MEMDQIRVRGLWDAMMSLPLWKWLAPGSLGLLGGCTLAVAGVGLITGLRIVLDPYIDIHVPFLLFFGNVLLTTWLGGLAPGLVAALLAALAATYLFIPPFFTLLKPDWGSYVALGLFLLEVLFMSWFAHRLLQERHAQEQSAAQLRENEERLQQMLGTAEIGISFGRANGTILDANDAFLRITGYARDEFPRAGLSWPRLTPPEYAELDRHMAERMMQTGAAGPWEKECLRKDGTRVPVLVSASRLHGKRDEHVVFIIDISERKRTEAEIQRLNERLEQRVTARTTELERTNADLRREVLERRLTELALEERESRLQALLASSGAIITMDEQGVIESANAIAENLLGWSAAELVGQSIGMLMPSPYREEHVSYLENYRRTGIQRIIGTTQEVLVQHRNGSTIPVELSVAEASGGPLRLFTGVLRDIRKRRALEHEVLEIASMEQQRFGQELHDGVGQELTGLTLLTDVLVHRLEHAPPEQRELAERVATGLERVHNDIRMLARGLVPMHVGPEGLCAALEDLAASTQEQTGISCAFACDEDVPIPKAGMAIHLFRIAQEAVSNALRHSQARHIFLTLRIMPTAVVLTIRDDGVGLPAEEEAGPGLGIRIMQYRGTVLGGAVQVRPAADGGTLVTCTLPRRSENG